MAESGFIGGVIFAPRQCRRSVRRGDESASNIELSSKRNEQVDGRRNEQRGQHDLGQHLADKKLGDREDPIESDRDEDERVDDLAQHAREARAGLPLPSPSGG